MSVSRRSFVRTLGLGGAGVLSSSYIIGRGREAAAWGADPFAELIQEAAEQTIRISSNENARGPSPKALEAIREHATTGVGRYPSNLGGGRRSDEPGLTEAIADLYGGAAENVLLGTGSGAMLGAAVRAYCGPGKHLVNGAPSYSSPNRTAELVGAEIRLVPVDSNLYLDLDGMAEAARGAGMVFVCNPNNPTSTVHTLDAITDFVARVKASSPDTAILLDEAYHDYATRPGSGSAGPVAMQYPDVFTTRTFSKAYGMAGLRLGYAVGQPETLAKLNNAWGLGDVNTLTAAAATAAVLDQEHMDWERGENARVRDFTVNALEQMGFEAADSQTNFIFVNLGRPAAEFREACAALGVRVGRDFPPMEDTHARISLGSMEEMQRAVEVFRQVLSPMTSGGGGGR